MAKICPMDNQPVIYLTCMECDVKACKDKDVLIENFNLKDIIVNESSIDGSPYINAVLYYNEIPVINFYEHSIEGGFYPNGEILDEQLYNQFIKLNKVGRIDSELDSFDYGVALIRKTTDSECYVVL